MTEPNLPIELMFKQVRLAVEQETNGAQIPWELSSLREHFAFNPVAGGSTSTPVVMTPPSPPPASTVGSTQVAADTSSLQTVPATTTPVGGGTTSTPATETPPRPPPSSTSGGTQVAVGVYPQPPQTLRNTIGMEFVLIPAGTFQMGSNDIKDSEEKPVHTVRLTQPFYLGKYEVTQGQWEAVMGNNPSRFKGDTNLPVEEVSWENVQEFITRLNTRERGTAYYRLPTEAEWEYAARAGSATVYSFGNNAGELGRYAWYGDNAGGKTHPVGQLQPNAWGLYDMHGNVCEWVQDWYGTYPSGTVTDPTGPLSGSERVHRGCGWRFTDFFCRSANRFLGARGIHYDALGFRLLRAVP